jgi:transposase
MRSFIINIKIGGIDLAKNFFQICVLFKDNTIERNYKVSRAKFLHRIIQLPAGTLIAMEACGTSHHWSRLFEALGHIVKLIPAQDVKPFVTNQKTMLMMRLLYVRPLFDQGYISFS